MKHVMHDSTQSQQGFTLVELAVVMIIIGLLVGGILKGQEMIANAQVTSTVAQVDAFEAATQTFQDMYDAMPGDMARPGARLPNCDATGGCNTVGNGDGRLDDGVFAVPGGEGQRFFVHLSAADLIGGINPSLPAGTWGGIYPEANIAGGFLAGYTAGGNIGGNANTRRGHYLSLVLDPGAIGSNTLTPSEAYRIDSKMDDGTPDAGAVFFGGNAACAAGGVYLENATQAVCDLALRIE